MMSKSLYLMPEPPEAAGSVPDASLSWMKAPRSWSPQSSAAATAATADSSHAPTTSPSPGPASRFPPLESTVIADAAMRSGVARQPREQRGHRNRDGRDEIKLK